MKKTGVCPKCGGTEIVLIPGGTKSLDPDTTLHYVPVGWRGVPVDRYVCCVCGFSEEWLREDDLEKVKKYWTRSVQ